MVISINDTVGLLNIVDLRYCVESYALLNFDLEPLRLANLDSGIWSWEKG